MLGYELFTLFTKPRKVNRSFSPTLSNKTKLTMPHLWQTIISWRDRLISHKPSSGPPVENFDGVRAVAAFMVFLQHLQTELVHWKGQVDRDVQGVRNQKADREELQNRFARLASAAMEEDPPAVREDDGFLLKLNLPIGPDVPIDEVIWKVSEAKRLGIQEFILELPIRSRHLEKDMRSWAERLGDEK